MEIINTNDNIRSTKVGESLLDNVPSNVDTNLLSFGSEIKSIIDDFNLDKALIVEHDFTSMAKYIYELEPNSVTDILSEMFVLSKFLCLCASELLVKEFYPFEDRLFKELEISLIRDLEDITDSVLDDLIGVYNRYRLLPMIASDTSF